MGKIVKYCAKCEEGFASKFVFCPNCGEHMDAFEMNPLHEEQAAPVSAFTASNAEAETSSPAVFETVPVTEEPVLAEIFAPMETQQVLELNSVDVPEETIEEPEVVSSATVNSNGDDYQTSSIFGFGRDGFDFSHAQNTQQVDDSFRPTVIEEKDTQLRNTLLVSFGTLFLAATIVAWIASLFLHALPVFALEDQDLFSFVGPIEPEPMELEEKPKKDDDDGGGGGGGGKENPEPATKGRLPNQVDKPLNPPMPVTQMTNPVFLVRNETQGNIKREMTSERVGLLNGVQSDNASSGSGTGDGIGNGRGTGVGNGIGTGEGNGNGSGSGNGNGNGNGDGNGDGDGTPQLTKKVVPVGVTEGIKILSRPQPRYTDSARQNNVQGTVTLRVTFLANGSIGSVSPVNGLPYGLTEQAIAAAKQIRFDPPKRNGQAYAVTKTVTYTFTIY